MALEAFTPAEESKEGAKNENSPEKEIAALTQKREAMQKMVDRYKASAEQWGGNAAQSYKNYVEKNPIEGKASGQANWLKINEFSSKYQTAANALSKVIKEYENARGDKEQTRFIYAMPNELYEDLAVKFAAIGIGIGGNKGKNGVENMLLGEYRDLMDFQKMNDELARARGLDEQARMIATITRTADINPSFYNKVLSDSANIRGFIAHMEAKIDVRDLGEKIKKIETAQSASRSQQ